MGLGLIGAAIGVGRGMVGAGDDWYKAEIEAKKEQRITESAKELALWEDKAINRPQERREARGAAAAARYDRNTTLMAEDLEGQYRLAASNPETKARDLKTGVEIPLTDALSLDEANALPDEERASLETRIAELDKQAKPGFWDGDDDRTKKQEFKAQADALRAELSFKTGPFNSRYEVIPSGSPSSAPQGGTGTSQPIDESESRLSLVANPQPATPLPGDMPPPADTPPAVTALPPADTPPPDDAQTKALLPGVARGESQRAAMRAQAPADKVANKQAMERDIATHKTKIEELANSDNAKEAIMAYWQSIEPTLTKPLYSWTGRHPLADIVDAQLNALNRRTPSARGML